MEFERGSSHDQNARDVAFAVLLLFLFDRQGECNAREKLREICF